MEITDEWLVEALRLGSIGGWRLCGCGVGWDVPTDNYRSQDSTLEMAPFIRQLLP
jgi:hypothetical protein